uniref:ORF1a protein n=1 Tax=Rousettus bat astrovirus TaxID=3141900 RepID=A0AAU7E241_9VIRU
MASARAAPSSGGPRAPGGSWPSVYDARLWTGSPDARAKALALDDVAKVKLKDLLGKGPFRWETTSWRRPEVDPAGVTIKVTPVKTVSVSGVDLEGDYVTLVFDPELREWVEETPSIHPETALVGLTVYEHGRLTREVAELKVKNSESALEISLLRHELARIRQEAPPAPSPAFPKVRLSSVILLGLLLGLLFASTTSADAVEGVCTQYWPNGDCAIFIPFKPQNKTRGQFDFGVLIDTARMVFKYTRDRVYRSQIVETFYTLMFASLTWEVVAAALGVATVLKSDRPFLLLLLLILSHVSSFKYYCVAIIPWMTLPSSCCLGLVMGIFYYDQAGAIVAAMALWVLMLMCSLPTSAETFYGNCKAGLMTLVATLLSHISIILHTPDWMVAVFVLAWRVATICPLTFAERIEFKDASGKVRKVVAASKNIFFQALRRTRQGRVREGIAPNARVQADSLVKIQSGEGEGTGFRVMNYIVTAGHVALADEVKVVWGSLQHVSRVVFRPPGKDIAFLQLPPNMQNLPTYKLPKVASDGTVVITSPDGGGVLRVAITEGVIVDDHITYAVQTQDGASGSPVCNTDGRVIGVHVTNTGFSGGAILLTPADLPPQKSAKELAMEAELRELRRQIEESRKTTQSNTADITQLVVSIVREAMCEEMKVLRAELNKSFDQAKGKTKHGRGRKRGAKTRRRRAFTEREYKELQEKGFTREQIRAMAQEILKREAYDDEDDTWTASDYESSDPEAGYPEWDDPQDDEEINREWFGQVLSDPGKTEPGATHPEHLEDKYSLEYYCFTPQEKVALGEKLAAYQENLKTALKRNLWVSGADGQVHWAPGVNGEDVIKDLHTAWEQINQIMFDYGFVPFTQRRRKPKPPKEQPKEQRQKNAKRGRTQPKEDKSLPAGSPSLPPPAKST